MRGDVAIDGLKRRVVGHHPLPGMILHLHAHHLINLHRHRTLREVLVQLANRAGAEPRLFKLIRAERGAEGDAAASTLPDFENLRPLRLQALEVGIPIVDDADVDRAQVQALDQGIEFRIILVDVSVYIDRLDFRKALEQRTLIACRGPGFLSCYQNGKSFTPTTVVVKRMVTRKNLGVFNRLNRFIIFRNRSPNREDNLQ